MDNEIPEVSFVRIVLMACGRKEAVVQKAAVRPKIVILFNFIMGLIQVKIEDMYQKNNKAKHVNLALSIN